LKQVAFAPTLRVIVIPTEEAVVWQFTGQWSPPIVRRSIDRGHATEFGRIQDLGNNRTTTPGPSPDGTGIFDFKGGE